MREIKFRAWNKRRRFMDSAWMIDFEHGLVCHSKHNASDINACVLMQFTGLKDKNGKDIYEGDIIQTGDDVFYILYSNKDFCHVFWLSSQKNYMTLPFLKGIKDFEVIGNIYENPKLLEVSHDT